jgi:hypothetical protein
VVVVAVALALVALTVVASPAPGRVGPVDVVVLPVAEPAMVAFSGYADIPLYSDGTVLSAVGLPQAVPVGAPVTDHPGALARQDRWLAAGSVPGPERYADLAETALRDLEALLLPGGVPVAAATGEWRYVWPRDASFVAAALARTGHVDDAFDVLEHLQLLQDAGADAGADAGEGGVFEARYLPDGSGGVPDGRGPQLDGNGWVLWAVAEWYDAAPARTRDRHLESLRPLVVRSVAAIRANVDLETGLPAISPDYWEVAESSPTLGTLAPLLVGLRSASDLLHILGEPPVADLTEALQRGLDEHFHGYPRHPGAADPDTAVAFLMPPFGPYDAEVEAAWRTAEASMARPGGGLAPGVGWRADGVSWTPTTAVFALTAAASGNRASATGWLDWLDAHRAPSGALPEKVLWDGSPSAVAPLAWTCATVILALDELDRLDRRPTWGDPALWSWLG